MYEEASRPPLGPRDVVSRVLVADCMHNGLKYAGGAVTVILLAMWLVGCGKPDTASNGKNEGGVADSSVALNLEMMNRALRRYCFEKRRMPTNLAELAASGHVRDLPVAPAGKRYEIDAGQAQVILVTP